MTPEQRADLIEILTLEREIEEIAATTLRAWLGTATAAALPVYTAAAIPPDPDAITRTAAAWEHELDNGFLPKFGAIVDRLLGDDRERLGEWKTRTLASVRSRMLNVPGRAAKKVEAALRETAGKAIEAAREAAARALKFGAWKADAAEIGRNQGVSLFNAARLARAQLEERDTGNSLDKMWISLHDGRTRHTHQLADRQRVPLAANFVVGGAELPYPGFLGGPPDEVYGCRCVVVILNSALEIPAPSRVASAADTGGNTMARSFEALIIPTGVPGRSQGWMLASNAQLVDTALPLAMKWQQKADPGHEGAYTVGVLETVELRDGAVWGTGTMLDSPEAADAIQQIEAGVTRPSVELFARSEVLTDVYGNPVTPEAVDQMMEAGAEFITRIDVAEIVAATLVSVPEFRDAHMILGDAVATSPDMSLVAAAVVEEDAYPAEFFDNPLLDEPTPIHVDETGRVVGHLAAWDTCHMGVRDRCVTPYRSHSGYAEFHQSSVKLETGDHLRVGRLTVGGGHGPAGQGMRAAVEHYDNVGTCWAFVRAGEDEHGIWVAGAINPAADQAMVKQALGTPHSGHWERVAGHPELIAACAVNAPGFPIVSRKRDREGDLAMVASFAPRQSRPPLDTSVLDDVAQRAVQAYAQQQAGEQRAASARELVKAAYGRRQTLAEVIRASHARQAKVS